MLTKRLKIGPRFHWIRVLNKKYIDTLLLWVLIFHFIVHNILLLNESFKLYI